VRYLQLVSRRFAHRDSIQVLGTNNVQVFHVPVYSCYSLILPQIFARPYIRYIISHLLWSVYIGKDEYDGLISDLSEHLSAIVNELHQ
jgi:hypothetical protein